MPLCESSLDALFEKLASRYKATWIADAAGISRHGKQIPALVHKEAYVDKTAKHRILVIGGLPGNQQDVCAIETIATAYGESEALKADIALSMVLSANPDALQENNAKISKPLSADLTKGYPPTNNFFFDDQLPESRYLWRWVTFMAPDFVLEIMVGESVLWEMTGKERFDLNLLNAANLRPIDSFLGALSNNHSNGLGAIPGFRITAPLDCIDTEIGKFFHLVLDEGLPVNSQARINLNARRERTPLEIAKLLANQYGHTLEPLVYTQGVAISGRLRLEQLAPSSLNALDQIVQLVEPLVVDIEKSIKGVTGQHLAGLVWCEELAVASGDERYETLLLAAANLFIGRSLGEPPNPCDRNYRTEDMFFTSAVLGRAYKLSGEKVYINSLSKFLLAAQVQQPDGLFWHADDIPFFWGRGNGFAAMAFAEALTYMDEDHPDRTAILSMHRRHMDALIAKQHPSGMLTQVMDVPGSYHEHTATSMVGYAVARGLRFGWLDSSFCKFAESLWYAALERIDEAGGLVDGCAGTGPQVDIRAYLDRPATYGFDDRTGNLALWFAVEMQRIIDN